MQYKHWKTDMKSSLKAIDKIKDDILPMLIGGKIHSVENSGNEILMLMDIKSGIDYIRENDEGLQGIAARFQFMNVAWNTFTIRYQRHTGTATEYEKRISQIDNGYFYPAFTMQGYFDNDIDLNLLSIAMVRTVDLFDFAQKHPEMLIEKKSDNLFKVIYWIDMSKFYKIIALVYCHKKIGHPRFVETSRCKYCDNVCSLMR